MVGSISGVGGFNAAMMQQKLEERFQASDVDGSGGVSKTEMSEAIAAMGGETERVDELFAQIDADGSGEISLEEQKAAMQERVSQLMGGQNADWHEQPNLDSVSMLLENLSEKPHSSDMKSAIDDLIGRIEQGEVDFTNISAELQGVLGKYLPKISVDT